MCALTKDEVIAQLQKEVRILLHLASKIERSQLDYRPTPKQRSTIRRSAVTSGDTTCGSWGGACAVADAATPITMSSDAVTKSQSMRAKVRSPWLRSIYRVGVELFSPHDPSASGSEYNHRFALEVPT